MNIFYVEVYCEVIWCYGCFLYCNDMLGCILLDVEWVYIVDGGYGVIVCEF